MTCKYKNNWFAKFMQPAKITKEKVKNAEISPSKHQT